MKKVLIVVGHSYDKKGAYNKKLDVHEYDIVKRIGAKIFMDEESKKFDTILKGRNTYKELPSEINDLDPDCIISLHLNAANGVSQGTETLYWNTSKKGVEFAEKIQKNMVEALGYRDRGLKDISVKDRGSYLLAKTKAPCVIIEPMFLDAAETLEEIERVVEKTSEVVLKTLYEEFGQ